MCSISESLDSASQANPSKSASPDEAANKKFSYGLTTGSGSTRRFMTTASYESWVSSSSSHPELDTLKWMMPALDRTISRAARNAFGVMPMYSTMTARTVELRFKLSKMEQRPISVIGNPRSVTARILLLFRMADATAAARASLNALSSSTLASSTNERQVFIRSALMRWSIGVAADKTRSRRRTDGPSALRAARLANSSSRSCLFIFPSPFKEKDTRCPPASFLSREFGNLDIQ
mmetsp:Transcript_32614/g.100879  ORF Transcript_32614/g.100879 Transcript_32614/m.100879 type:complete len:235 (+) Transcript_32614:144-848(+)